MTDKTHLRLIRKAQRAQARTPAREAYEALEADLTQRRAAWFEANGSFDGFYDAHKADMDKLTGLFNATQHGPTAAPAPRVEAEPSGRSLIQLWLPLDQREAFRAVCTRAGLSMSAMLRAMIVEYLKDE